MVVALKQTGAINKKAKFRRLIGPVMVVMLAGLKKALNVSSDVKM